MLVTLSSGQSERPGVRGKPAQCHRCQCSCSLLTIRLFWTPEMKSEMTRPWLWSWPDTSSQKYVIVAPPGEFSFLLRNKKGNAWVDYVFQWRVMRNEKTGTLVSFNSHSHIFKKRCPTRRIMWFICLWAFPMTLGHLVLFFPLRCSKQYGFLREGSSQKYFSLLKLTINSSLF